MLRTFRVGRDERGSILPLTILLVAVTLTFTAFAVDLGTKRVARSDMQAVATVVAVDMARHINGRTKAAIEADPDWLQARDRTVARNKTTVGSRPTVQLVLGKVDSVTGAFSTVTSAERPTAVKATASSSVSFSFIRGSGSTSRSAVASVDPGVCFSVGSFLVALDTNEGALTSMLSSIIGTDIRLLGSGGLASIRDLQVPLAGIAAQLGVATADELVALPNLTVATFIKAMASVVDSQGNAAEANLLNAIAVHAPNVNLKLAEILKLAPGDNAALALNANVLEMLGAALYVASNGNAIAVPNLGLNLGLADVKAKVKVVEPPQMACGRVGATAKSAQVQVDLTTKVGGVLTAIAGADVVLGLQAAAATGTVTSLKCATGTQPDSVGINVVTGLVNDLKVKLAIALLVGVKVGADVTAATVGTSSTNPLTFNYPAAPGMPAPQSVAGIDKLNLAALQIALTLPLDPLGLLSAILGGVLDAVVKPLLVLLDPLLVALLTPILKLVGASLGGADVSMSSRVNCAAPRVQG